MGSIDSTLYDAGLMRQRAATLTEQLMDAIRSRIATRVLGPGDRLPSVRAFAETMNASPSTVVEAYDRLAAEGVIRARRGSGFYVTGANLPPLSVGEIGPGRDRAIDPFWVSRQSLDADATMEKPGCGWLSADWMPDAALRRGLRGVSRADTSLLSEYGSTRGSLPLRRLLLRRFADEGIEADPDQLLLTGSGTQAIDLVCRYLLHPGDTVLVDDPGYFNFQALLRAHRVELVGVPYTPTGPDIEAFEAALIAHRPRLYITNSALHNPTGATMSPQTAHRLLRAGEIKKRPLLGRVRMCLSGRVWVFQARSPSRAQRDFPRRSTGRVFGAVRSMYRVSCVLVQRQTRLQVHGGTASA
jgi:DNA-binding transcriptional MocR family regulator